MGKEGKNKAATKLFEFAEDGLFESMQVYFKENPTSIRSFLTMTGVYNRKLLHVACNKGSIEIVKFLMEHLEKENLLSSIDDLDQYRNSALYLCCVNGVGDGVDEDELEGSSRAEIVTLLKSKGSSTLLFKGRNNPLHWACFHGDIELVKANENKDFAIDLITQNPNTKKNTKIELLTMFLERGDPNQAKSSISLKLRKIQNNLQAHTRYIIQSHTEAYPYRLLMWASYLGSVEHVKVYLNKECSPFVKARKKRNALFVAATQGHVNLVQLFLEKIESPKDRESLFQLSKDRNQNTPLHKAIKNGKINSADYLVEAGNPLDAYNDRGWLPHQMTRSTDKAILALQKKINNKLKEKEKKQLSALGDFYKVKTGYQYCLVAKKENEPNEKNLVRIQLSSIREEIAKDERGSLDIVEFEGYLNSDPRTKDKYLIYLLRMDDKLTDYIAKTLEVRAFNSKFGFLEKFDDNHKEEYERFRTINVQRMMNYVLNREFNVNLFLQEGFLIDAFPLHSFTERSQIGQAWKKENKLKKIIKWNDLLLHKEARIDHLKPLTACTFYYGTGAGWYLTFLSSITTDLLIPSIAFLPFAILDRFLYITDESPYIPYLSIIISLWATLYFEKWKRRQNEIRYLWDLTEFENSRALRPGYGGEFKIDRLTRKVIQKDRISEDTRRIILELPLTAFGIAVIIGIFYGFMRAATWAAPDSSKGETYDNIPKARLFLDYIVGPLQGFVIVIVNKIYAFLATKAVHWENHMYEDNRENSYVFKNFVFQFANSYITLFYYAFINVNFYQVRKLLISFFVTKGITQISLSVLVPYFFYRLKAMFLNRKFERVTRDKTIEFEYITNSRPDRELEEIEDDDEENEGHKVEKEVGMAKDEEEVVVLKMGDSEDGESAHMNGQENPNAPDAKNLEMKPKDISYGNGNGRSPSQPKVIFTEQENFVEKSPGLDHLAKDRKNRTKKNLLLQIEFQKSVMVVKNELAEEYSYLAIMFGYITMFSPAFPWGPVLLFGTNWIKLQLDMWGLSTFTKRSYLEETGSLGIWNTIFEVLAFISVFVNGLFVLITTKTITTSFPVPADSTKYYSLYRDLIVVVVAEHIIILIKLVIQFLIDDVPNWVQDGMKARQYKQEKAIKERTASGKKKNDQDELMSEDKKFILRMFKFLNNPSWLKKYLSEDPSSDRKILDICQSMTKALKQHIHQTLRKNATAEFEETSKARMFPEFERRTPFASIDNGAKLSMFHQ